ncbi:MAG: S41 family peptidase [Bacillota bacterium]
MTFTHHRVGRCIILLALCLGLGGFLPSVHAQTSAQPPVANAAQLKLKAIEAVKAGDFRLGNDYLNQAAALTKDPVLTKMASWSKQFEEQREQFVGERRREYDKAVREAHTLIEKHQEAFALEIAARAYTLTDNKDGFRHEPWVAQLLSDTKRMAEEFEKGEQWIKAMRLYSLLSAIEPEVPQWKDRMKTSARRIRLVALYTPDEMKKIQEADAKERDQVEAMLNPTTKPTTRPDDEAADNNKIDWRESLRGVQMDMLAHALVNARTNYYREVGYAKLMQGGLEGLRIVLTTPVLRNAFPTSQMNDPAKCAEFLGIVDAFIAKAKKVREQDEAEMAQAMLRELREANNRTVKLPEQVLVYEFADGAFSVLDQFSYIIWPSDYEDFSKTTTGEFSGVGIQIQADETGYLKVVSPLEDSPAYKAGIKADSIITHIDGKSARWITTTQAVKRITGPAGTSVVLTIKDPAGGIREYTLKRDTIKFAVVKGWFHRPGGGWDYFIDPEQKIAYIRLTNFTKTAAADLDRSISEITRAGARGIIFDLRNNPGGLLPTATEIVDDFVEKGDIVSTRPDRPDSPSLPNTISCTRKASKTKLPLVVLVNQMSASASEIVAGALKDHHRALIVGERTFGKGSVQILHPLGTQEAYLKLTTSHYYLPNGKCIHREENSKEWGVDPDVVVEMTPEQIRTAMEARHDFDILREVQNNAAPASETPATQPVAANGKKDPLATDAQLSAALLLMRLQLTGGDQLWAQAQVPAATGNALSN